MGIAAEMLDGFYEGVEKDYGSLDADLAKLGVKRAARDLLVQKLTQ